MTRPENPVVGGLSVRSLIPSPRMRMELAALAVVASLGHGAAAQSSSADELHQLSYTRQVECRLLPNSLLEVPALPDSGFSFEYFLYLPVSTPTDQEARLLVIPNNTGQPDDDAEVHRASAREVVHDEQTVALATRLRTPLLVPVFPRPGSQPLLYTHALDRDALLVSDGPLKRLDLQLAAMIAHAQGLLRASGVPVKDQVFMLGFSASGLFANRFAALHPGLVRAVAAGGVNGLPIIPRMSLDGVMLPYPIGVGDLQTLTGAPFDSAAYAGVSQLIFMGELDSNETFSYNDCWNDEERAIIRERFSEVMMPYRWERSRQLLNEHRLPIECVTYSGTGHMIRPEMLSDIEAFLAVNDGPVVRMITPHWFPAAASRELAQVHVNGLYWRGDARLPNQFRNRPERMDLLISIQDWLFDQDYHQLDVLFERYGFAFELRAKDQKPIEVNSANYWGNVSAGDGSFQAFVVNLTDDQVASIRSGVSYALVPVGAQQTGGWVVPADLALVRPE